MSTEMEIHSQQDFHLFDFPDEILLLIMMNLNDKELLVMANDRRLHAIAKEAFGKIYCGTGRYFEVEIHYTDSETKQQMKYAPIFKISGDNIGAININLGRNTITRNHWIINCIQNYCQSITHMILAKVEGDLTILLSCMPKLKHLHLSQINLLNLPRATTTAVATFKCPVLQSFKETDVNWTNKERFQFLSNNSQLETLSLELDPYVQQFFHLLTLPRLKKLHLIKNHSYNYNRFSGNSIFKMPNLEMLNMTNGNSDILMAIASCKCVTKITLDRVIWGDADDIGKALSEFKQLESLEVKSTELEDLNKIAEHLPNLSRLNVSEVVDFVKIGQGVFHTWMFSTKLSHLTIRVPYLPDFSHSFIRKMADATQHNPQMKIKFYADECDSFDNITSHQGLVRHNNAILYWSGYDYFHRQSSTGLLDLNDKCIQKIMDFVSINDLGALFNTCKRTQSVVKSYFLKNIDREWNMPASLNKNVFESVGEYIRKANISQKIRRNKMADQYYSRPNEFWRDLKQYCIHLTELTSDSIDIFNIDGFNSCPSNLAKIKLSSCHATGFRNLRLLGGHKLTHLEIHKLDLKYCVDFSQGLNLGDDFRHLTVLKFGEYNRSVESFLMGLDDSVCQQIKELSFGKYCKEYIQSYGVSKLTRTAMRFNTTIMLRIIDDCSKMSGNESV